MKIAIDTLPDVFDRDLESSPEWPCVISGNHNLLLEGPTYWTDAVLQDLAPLLPAPVIWTTAQTLRSLSAGERGTLVLQDVGALRRDDQARLYEWLHDGRRQVISTTSRPLFPELARGGFDEALYYRLNCIRMCAPSHLASDR